MKKNMMRVSLALGLSVVLLTSANASAWQTTKSETVSVAKKAGHGVEKGYHKSKAWVKAHLHKKQATKKA